MSNIYASEEKIALIGNVVYKALEDSRHIYREFSTGKSVLHDQSALITWEFKFMDWNILSTILSYIDKAGYEVADLSITSQFHIDSWIIRWWIR